MRLFVVWVFGLLDGPGDIHFWIRIFPGMTRCQGKGLLHTADPYLIGSDKDVLVLHVGGESEGTAHRFEIDLEDMNVQFGGDGDLADDDKISLLDRTGEIIDVDALCGQIGRQCVQDARLVWSLGRHNECLGFGRRLGDARLIRQNRYL